jgi:hypothetical protein
MTYMLEVRRTDDSELCGFVDEVGGLWRAMAVFGGTLATFEERETAFAHVLEHGLASLAERWWLRTESDSEWQVVCIQEASPSSVRLALDYYSMPGVPTVTFQRSDLESSVELRLEPE